MPLAARPGEGGQARTWQWTWPRLQICLVHRVAQAHDAFSTLTPYPTPYGARAHMAMDLATAAKLVWNTGGAMERGSRGLARAVARRARRAAAAGLRGAAPGAPAGILPGCGLGLPALSTPATVDAAVRASCTARHTGMQSEVSAIARAQALAGCTWWVATLAACAPARTPSAAQASPPWSRLPLGASATASQDRRGRRRQGLQPTQPRRLRPSRSARHW